MRHPLYGRSRLGRAFAVGILLLIVISGSNALPAPFAPALGTHVPLSRTGATVAALPPSHPARPISRAESTSAWVDLSSDSVATPPCGGDQGIAYDPLLWEFVSFGGVIPCTLPGFAGGYTWTFSNGTWTNLSASLPTAPSPRYGMAMTYDAADGYIVGFGGATSAGVPFNDTWIFNGTWVNVTNRQTTSPTGVFNAGVAYDASTSSVVLVDGFGLGGNVNATWSFSGGQWSQLHPTSLPPAIHSPGMLYDASTSSILLFGGVSIGGQIQSETWSFAGGNWTQLFPTISPPAVFDPTAFYDGVGQRPIVFGGYTQLPGSYAPVAGTWTFSNGNWSNISSSVTGSPSPRGSARAAWDPDQNWTLVFGGRASSVSLLDDTWGFPGAPLWGARLTSSAPSLDLGSSANLTATPNGGIAPFTFVYSGLTGGLLGGQFVDPRVHADRERVVPGDRERHRRDRTLREREHDVHRVPPAEPLPERVGVRARPRGERHVHGHGGRRIRWRRVHVDRVGGRL